MFKVVITYPSVLEEVTVVERMAVQQREAKRASTAADLLDMQRIADALYVHPKLMEYAVTLANVTRRPKDFGLGELAPYVSYGSSPRASLNMIIGAKALGLLRGREYVLPEDGRDIAPEVMRHRLVTPDEALAQNNTADPIVSPVLGP